MHALLKRIGLSIFVLIGLSMLIFIISRVIPGDPARIALGPRTPEWAVQELRKEMYLDKSIPIQYAMWVKGLFQGDFGTSLLTKRPVSVDIREFFPATLEIVVVAAIVMAFGGIALGIFSGETF